MKSRITLFVLAIIVWMVLNWVPDWQDLLLGILVCGLVAYFTGDLFIERPKSVKDLKRLLWFAYYVPIFLWEVFKANVDVAYRVGHPDMPIHPGIVKIKTGLKSDMGLTFLANSITLTPGTLSVDVDKEGGYLYVHWIEVKDKDVDKATAIVSERFEKILRRIFE